MTPDPRWLEILKATGWQTTAVAAACGLFLLANYSGWLPPVPELVMLVVIFMLLLCGCLALASIGAAAVRFLGVKAWVIHNVRQRREKRALRDYIPHMTEEDRGIIAYLLAKNQKMFSAASNGGYANTLLARGIVVVAAQPGMPFSSNDMPCAIPDHLWPVLVEHRERFPYTPPRKGETETHPWRVPWMLA